MKNAIESLLGFVLVVIGVIAVFYLAKVSILFVLRHWVTVLLLLFIAVAVGVYLLFRSQKTA